MKPDIYIKFKKKDGIERVLIIDTKYKELKQGEKNYGVSQSDIYQMVMYGLRYFEDNEEQKEIILLYPQYGFDINLEEIKLETKENIIIKIKTISLHRNLMKCKNELKEELQEIIKN